MVGDCVKMLQQHEHHVQKFHCILHSSQWSCECLIVHLLRHCSFEKPLIWVRPTWGRSVNVVFLNHLPDYSNQLVESLVYVHTDFGWSLHVCDLQLSGQLLALFLGYLRQKEEENNVGGSSNINRGLWHIMFWVRKSLWDRISCCVVHTLILNVTPAEKRLYTLHPFI